jgi:hypothetical protein
LKAAGLQGGKMWSKLMGAICANLLSRNHDFGDLDLESLLADGLESDSTAAINLLRELSTRIRQIRNGWDNTWGHGEE